MTTTEPVRRLDWQTKQPVQYAVPLWLRDEQVKANVARVSGRIQPVQARRTEPIAVVGYGPSLRDTWEQIRAFPFVITCSGSHRFLLDRGIVPQWHVEVDPRDHKIALLGEPHHDVEYLIASTCHPKYLAHLEGFTVKLWHVFDATADGIRLLPPGEWAVTGGCDVGLRAMTIAGFLGFRELHVFGLDGCARGTDRHAAVHPHGTQKYALVEYDGQPYYTTPAMLEAAKQTVHELKQMPGVTATFYGDGLTQAMVRSYVPEPADADQPLANVVGFQKPELISAEYLALNAQLHRENLAYGVGGGKHAETVQKLAATLTNPSILDYGCGKGYLAKALARPIWEYDPAIEGKQESPRPADLVVCTDVLEHVEPDRLMDVLKDLRRVVKEIGYFVIDTGPAQKTLADGRNTHLIQRDAQWWRATLQQVFRVGTMKERGRQVHVIVAPKQAGRRASVRASAVISAPVGQTQAAV
jgi:6-hydroxymethylpterin diphosphokinase MptE-like protein/methyltransferase family protein